MILKKHSTISVSNPHHSHGDVSDSGASLRGGGNVLSFRENWRSMTKRFGKKYRRYELALCDIPKACLPAVLATEGGRNGVVLLEKSDEFTFRVALPDGRESLVSQYFLEKIYDGICALPSSGTIRSGKNLRSVLEPFSNFLADNPLKVSAALLANFLTLIIVLFVKSGYEQSISGNVTNRPLLVIGAGLTAGLLAYGITGLRHLINQVKWKDGKRRVLYSHFVGSNVDAAVDLIMMPVFLALSLSTGGLAVTVPLLIGMAFVGSHLIQTRQLQSLLTFPNTWAGPLQWVIFFTTLLSIWLVSGTAGFSIGRVISSLIIATVCMERVVRSAGLVRNFRIALMGNVGTEDHPPVSLEVINQEGFSGIEVSNLVYTHPQSGVTGVSGANFTIKPGEQIGVFGVAGSGKSTLCRLLAGVLCPEHGEIKTNGKIGFLPSDAAIIYGTIRSNILLGHVAPVPNYLVEKIVQVVGLQELVENNPLGLDLPVSERGESLSPLQRRALCLARVLLHSPEILILDEPGCQLSRGDAGRFLQMIKQYWLNCSRTRILISSISSQGETPFMAMDRVLIMENGRIVGKSSPQQFKKIIKVVRDSGQNNGLALESAACHQLQ